MDWHLIISVSLAVLAGTTLIMLIVLIPLALQFHRTLTSAQHLFDTINDDLEPAMKEIKQGVTEIRSRVKQYSSPVTSVFNKLSVVLASSAHGVLTGVKKYIDELSTSDKSDINGKSM
ncbi:MAG: hypothetical protein HYR97_01090 [Candidatus Melainabacteria bacterium]|nr:hypothetical protein [Candidatus Melainabacteria bacterium]MBI3307922.1 hypothetical protein [Candidatus Melainabacteria bacterium]